MLYEVITNPEEASLRETLAAGMVLLTGWGGNTPLVDPACGAGTIPIEAALLGAGRAPGLLRSSFGFQRLAGYDRKAWERMVAEAREQAQEAPKPQIEGTDRSGEAVRGASRNSYNFV